MSLTWSLALFSSLALTGIAPPAAAAGAPDPADDRRAGSPASLVIFVFDRHGVPRRDIALAELHATPDETGALIVQSVSGVHEWTLVIGTGDARTKVPLGPLRLEQGIESELFVIEGEDATWRPAWESVPLPLEEPMAPAVEPATGEGLAACIPPPFVAQIQSARDEQPVPGARVWVRGSEVEALSDAEGSVRLVLPAGTYSLSVVHPAFAVEILEQVQVSCTPGDARLIALTPKAGTLDTLIVRVPHVAGTVGAGIDAKKRASTITEVMSSEQMRRSGDGDAASALRRVTGLTVVGGKYVYVRGLGERYSATLFNGASLPSPEPERRVVPLDLFPSGMLESMVIRKAYSPELPGEFGGGVVELRTRRIPDEFTLKASVSGNALLGTTWQPGLRYAGGSTDWLGMDDGTRALPADVRQASAEQALLPADRFATSGYDAAALEGFGERMPNVWSPREALVPPGMSLSFDIGDRFEAGPWTWGYLGALSYGNSYRTLRYHRDYFLVGANQSLERSHAYDFVSTELAVDAGAMWILGARLGEVHDVSATTFLGRITDDETRVYQGYNRDVDTQIRVQRLRFVERTLFAEQLAGKHALPSLWGANLTWGYTYALALRGEPDRRETRYDEERGQDRWLLSNRPEGNQRFFSDLVDHSHDVRADLHVPLPFGGEPGAALQLGAAWSAKSRDVQTRRYKFQHKGPLTGDPKVIARPAEEIFVPDTIRPDGFQFEEFTQPTDNYDAQQQVGAGYATVDVPLSAAWRLQGGARLEYGNQAVRTFELFNPNQTPVRADIVTLDVLPALNLGWRFVEDMQLRASSSVTVSRPDFRELSPATFNDVTGGRQIFGNPDLQRALIYAGDLRWEWYPLAGATASAALFYKHFQDPIEQVVIASAQQSVTFQNALAADNVGLELEGRWPLAEFSPLLSGFTLGGNVSLIQSQVRLAEGGITTSKERPLQGQSPYVVNLQLGYDHEESGLRLTTLYNVYGPRILEVGAQGAPDVYEEPFHAVDLLLSQKLAAGFSWSASLKNALDLPRVEVQGDEVLTRVQLGRALTFGLSWAY